MQLQELYLNEQSLNQTDQSGANNRSNILVNDQNLNKKFESSSDKIVIPTDDDLIDAEFSQEILDEIQIIQ